MTKYENGEMVCDDCKQVIIGSYISSTTFYTMQRCMACYKKYNELTMEDYKEYIEGARPQR